MDRYEVDGLVISTGPVMTTIEPKEDIGSGPVHLSSVLFSGLLMDHDWIETEIYEELRKPEHGKLKEKMEEWPIPILGCPVLKHGVAGQEARAGASQPKKDNMGRENNSQRTAENIRSTAMKRVGKGNSASVPGMGATPARPAVFPISGDASPFPTKEADGDSKPSEGGVARPEGERAGASVSREGNPFQNREQEE